MEKQILEKAYAELKKACPFPPKVALILGSGLNGFADTLQDAREIACSKVPGLLPSNAPGHAGTIVFGSKQGTAVMAMKGRVHLYEGYTSTEVVRTVRLAAMLGVKTMILTNSAGGINTFFTEGSFMAIRDHINLVPSPLIGENLDFLGTRFPDMTNIYNTQMLNDLLHMSNKKVQSGVYLQTTGPQYETPSEINAYRMMGADAVGMSTAIEAIAARHAGLDVIGLSCITNMATGIKQKRLSHEEVGLIAGAHGKEFESLLDIAIAVAARG